MKNTAQRGQVLPLVALCLVVLLGFAALAVDAGYLQYQQRLQQTAADAAAIAGGWQLVNGNSPSAAGLSAAATNGFTNDGVKIIVTATSPPASGPNAGNTSAVEAIVKASHPGIFSGVLGSPTNWVTTRAVAVLQGAPSAPCIYVLNGDFNIANGSVTGACGVLVSKDVQANNKTKWSIPSIGAGNHIQSPPSNAVVSTGIPPFADPCSTIPGCKALAAMYPLNSNVANEGPYKSCTAPTPTMVPGCYTSINSDYNLAPGLYVISGDLTGSLTCTSCGATNGVTVVVGGRVNLNGGTTNISAPPPVQGAGPASVTQSGGAPGVVLYQVGTSTSPENFSAQTLGGMVYAPDAHINQNAGSSLSVGLLVVADFVSNGNNITITNNSPAGSIIQEPVLAE